MSEPHYPRCPRCSGAWEEAPNGSPFLQCKCGIRYWFSQAGPFIVYSDIVTNGDILLWNIALQLCVYHGIVAEGKGVSLPWLPFDIKIDKLKLYLTFA